LVAKGKFKQAEEILKQSSKKKLELKGNVSLVGVGPGDSGLLTLRGLQLMQQADVVLYDCLISEEILELIRRDADKICVGKCSGKHLVSQQEINFLLINLAKQGKRVVRLKGGDPFIFGRGGEELQQIAKAGILFQVVPGITAASGVTAYAGIPLTHREYSQGVTFITGHSHKNNVMNWKIFAYKYHTLVIYMGIENAKKIGDKLIMHGRSVQTPVAIISRGTCKDHQVRIGTLEQTKKK